MRREMEMRPHMGIVASKRGFTLIEMLAVIAIIAILAGMIFKLFGYATRQSLKAQTISKLEKVAHALNEYRAEYGTYPPVGATNASGSQAVAYEYENSGFQAPWLKNNYFPKPGAWDPKEPPLLFNMGLLAYLFPRGPKALVQDWGLIPHTNNYQWVGDTARDLDAKARWASFLDGVVHMDTVKHLCMGYEYWNDIATVWDGWDHDIYYECRAPYMKYRLWSAGPDGGSGTKDDIHRDSWDD
jgi:prepilin-type N-terminal cleavage/methylation domain-containing protein